MERGTSHGARGFVRAFRDDPFSTGDNGALSALGFFDVSSFCDRRNVELVGGDARVLASGRARVDVVVAATGLLLLSALRVTITRLRAGRADVIFVDRRLTAPTGGVFSVGCGGSVGVARGDLIRVHAGSIGVGSVSFVVGSEVGTWIEISIA